MDLAKNCLDIGLFTNDIEAMSAFYEGQLGLVLEEKLPVGRGVLQWRYGLFGSVLKINHARDPLPEAATGWRGLIVPGLTARDLVDPEGVPVAIRPDLEGIVIDVAAPTFWEQVGTTRLRVVGGPSSEGAIAGLGFRYVTVQVRDVAAEHAALLEAGAVEGMPPTRLGEVAKISMIRDAHGNWIEISQRASLTGPRPG